MKKTDVIQALKDLDWSGVSIGHKCIIQAAIHELEKNDLRDQFAGQALMGLLTNEQCKPFGMSFDTYDGTNNVSEKAYRMADAMLVAREKTA